MWMLAICFEVVIIATAGAIEGQWNRTDVLETSKLAIGALRILLLTAMAGAFLVEQSHLRASAVNEQESESLLGNGHAQNKYDGSLVKPMRQDAQSTGWLDYFIGFKKLFPYVW